MVCKTKKMPAMSPDPFLACVVGSGNETRHLDILARAIMSCQKNSLVNQTTPFRLLHVALDVLYHQYME